MSSIFNNAKHLTLKAVRVAKREGLTEAVRRAAWRMRPVAATPPEQLEQNPQPPEIEEPGFDHLFYRTFYPDLSHMDRKELLGHYREHGKGEGRYPNEEAFIRFLERNYGPLPKDFDAREYASANPHLGAGLPNKWELMHHYVEHGRSEGLEIKRTSKSIYTATQLHELTNHAYNMPDVILDENRHLAINVLVPAFDFGSMSAGFFGVFQMALFIKRCGFNVRLVLYDRFTFDLETTKKKLQGYPGMEHLLDELELEYIGDREAPLRISPQDNCVATVWYSAYLARKIMQTRGSGKFMYLIQDYESMFYPASSNFALAEQTYDFDYFAIFSTRALESFFLKKKIGVFARQGTEHIYFNNACSSMLPTKAEFIANRSGRRTRRLAFYSRPAVNRNMFEIGAMAMQASYQAGIFEGHDWEFIGIGLGSVAVEIADGVYLKQMERMNLRDYQRVIGSFDIGFTLMASSHPSLLPFDLAGSGAVVVTNSFGVKDQAYFDEIVDGVIVSEPDVNALTEALRKAVISAEDLETRYDHAQQMRFPRDWESTFGEEHVAFIRSNFS